MQDRTLALLPRPRRSRILYAASSAATMPKPREGELQPDSCEVPVVHPLCWLRDACMHESSFHVSCPIANWSLEPRHFSNLVVSSLGSCGSWRFPSDVLSRTKARSARVAEGALGGSFPFGRSDFVQRSAKTKHLIQNLQERMEAPWQCRFLRRGRRSNNEEPSDANDQNHHGRCMGWRRPTERRRSQRHVKGASRVGSKAKKAIHRMENIPRQDPNVGERVPEVSSKTAFQSFADPP